MNLVIKQTRIVEVPVTTLSVAATCQQAMLIDASGQCVGSTGDMPEFMPTLLEIDLATGAIKNWNVPTVAQLQAIADGQSAAVAPTPLTEQRMAELMLQSKQVEIDTFKPSEVVPDTVAVLEKYAPHMPSLVDESQMPYGYFDDERDPALLNAEPTLGSTSAPPQVVESAAVTVANAPDCAPADQQHNPLEVLDEPTDADTALCPDVPDSFYAAPVTPPMIDVNNIVMYGASLSSGTVPDAEPVAPTQPAQQLDQVYVWFDAATEKWTAETKDYASQRATSTQGKFEAIKNVLKKAGLHGVYEINLVPVLGASSVKGDFYTYDGSRTLDADTVYMTQGADGAWSARMPNNRPVSAVIGIDGALTGLLKEMEGIQPEDAVIIETTDDEMRSRNKRRYAVTAKHEHAPVETSTAIPVDLLSAAPTPATAEPVADPDDVVPVCTLKQKLEPLPTITDNGDLPSDFDGDASDDKIEVLVYKRNNSGEYAATTGAGATYVRASSKYCANDALKNLIKKCKLTVADSAIVETTTDDDVAQNRTRYSIDTSFAQYEPLPVDADPVAQIDIEDAIAEAPESADPVIQPAPVDVVTKLNMHPGVVRDQLSLASANQADPIYVAFFTARGLMEDGKLSSKGLRLLSNLGQARGIGSATQMIENAIEMVEKPATYAEIVALINHATEKMQLVKLIDRIAKHSNHAERQALYALQKNRIDALKADSAA